MSNNSSCEVFRFNEKRLRLWSHIKVGDILQIFKGDQVPADCLVLQVSNQENTCYVQTSNLDGETNLKARNTIAITKEMPDLVTKSLKVIVDLPSNSLTRINGSILDTSGKIENFTYENVLLRSSILRNVDYVLAIVIYTGTDTKLMQNIKCIFKKKV